MNAEDNLKKINLKLPKTPDPVGSYIATKTSNKFLFISGQISIDENGISPISLAIELWKPSMLKILISKKLQLNIYLRNGSTPLYQSVWKIIPK